MSDETIEDIFKRELIQQYIECKKYTIPKTEYYQTTDILKSAAVNAKSNTRNEYYLLSK